VTVIHSVVTKATGSMAIVRGSDMVESSISSGRCALLVSPLTRRTNSWSLHTAACLLGLASSPPAHRLHQGLIHSNMECLVFMAIKYCNLVGNCSAVLFLPVF
jgi:hypothetical protein